MQKELDGAVKTTQRNRVIDGLRAYAAICIVFMHVLTNGKYNLSGFIFDKIIPSFADFVFLFMCISAYALCCGYYEKFANNKVSLKSFYSKRYLRILPFFALLCLLDFIISPSINSLGEVFANITLCFGLLPNPNMSVIGVGWFLGLIFVFYIAFPFFCYLIGSKGKAWFVFACTVLFNFLCEIQFGAGRTNILYCAMFFVAGGLLYLYREKFQNLKLVYRLLILALACSVYAVYLLVYSKAIVVLVLSILLMMYAISGKSAVIDNPITRFIADISMEIYLSHMLIFRLIEKTGITKFLENELLSYVVVAVFTVLGAIAFSVVTKKLFKIIEMWFGKIKSKNKEKTA